MNTTEKRNIIGSIICAIMCLVIGGVGIMVFMLREVYQSKKYGFPIEVDDIKRYSIIGGVASAIELIGLLLWIFL
jgi:hypothetical protein